MAPASTATPTTPAVRTIHLPAIDRTVTLGAYLKAVRAAKANPSVEFKHGLTCWWPCTGAEILGQFLSGLHDRINQCVPYSERIGA
jgi:hypothetical protein